MNSPFQIDNKVVFPELNKIKIDGRSVKVEPRVMKLLIHLVEKKGQLCTREELMDSIWGGDIVNRHALTRALSDLRKVLGDSPSAPIYLETISKQGYRFIGSVKHLDGQPKQRLKINPWKAAALVLLVLISGLAYTTLSKPKPVYGNKVIKKSVPVIVSDTTGMPDSVFHRKAEAIVDAEVEKVMRD